ARLAAPTRLTRGDSNCVGHFLMPLLRVVTDVGLVDFVVRTSRNRTMKPSALRLDRLESRLAPALATWDGGGADNHWTTAANWVGDVVPQPGDDLVFPAGAARLGNVN